MRQYLNQHQHHSPSLTSQDLRVCTPCCIQIDGAGRESLEAFFPVCVHGGSRWKNSSPQHLSHLPTHRLKSVERTMFLKIKILRYFRVIPVLQSIGMSRSKQRHTDNILMHRTHQQVPVLKGHSNGHTQYTLITAPHAQTASHVN